jgi:hypothetical protein
MKVRTLLVAFAASLLLIASRQTVAQEKPPEHPKKEHPTDKKQVGLSKTDLAAGIRTWVDKESAANGGWLKVEDPVQHKTLELKLEKVHDDRLSQVGPDRYFACADFTGKDGMKYDIDVFMDGKTKDDLKETEVSVHKINGKERYSWFEENGTWKKKPAA